MKTTNMLLAAAFAVLCAGCASDPIPVSPRPQPIQPAPAPIRVVSQANANFSLVSEVSTKLRAVFRWPNSEANFSQNLAERLAGRVILEKAEVVMNSTGDVVILINPEFELVDKTREYYRVNCNQITVTIASNQKVYAITTAEPKPMPRKLGAQNAKNQYLNPAVNAIEPFLRRELDKLSREQVAVSVLDFGLANIQDVPNSVNVAAQVNRISRILGSMPGVVNYTIIRQDVAKASCSFRVVYMKDKLPQGLSNAVNLNLAGK